MRRCGSCNRPLRGTRSVRLGYGPNCWDRLDEAERTAVFARLRAENAARRRIAELAATAPTPVPRPPQRSDSPLAIILAWSTGLLAVLAVVALWRWLLLGIGLLVATAVAGLVIERVQERRLAAERPLRIVRPYPREGDVPAPRMGTRTVPTTPSGVA
jgi:hypothetical protein